jgi:hypothetical protein
MTHRAVGIAVITLSVTLIAAALGVFLFRGSIDSADRLSSIVSAFLALLAAATALYTAFAARRQAKTVQLLSESASEAEFLTSWLEIERQLRKVTHRESATAPLKVLIKEYEELPGVAESDINDILLLLRVRNGLVHPDIRKGVSGPSETKSITEAMNRQLLKLQTIQRGTK